MLVLEGDLETQLDAQRIRDKGIDALQITTGGACHLEAHQIQQAYEALAPDAALRLHLHRERRQSGLSLQLRPG